ncbi:MAG: hypothetical protein R2704_11275 [Microthrixaceae bacterium]
MAQFGGPNGEVKPVGLEANCSGWRSKSRLPGDSIGTLCQAKRPSDTPRAPGSSDSRTIAPKSKMAKGRPWPFSGLEYSTSPLMSAGHSPETTSSSKLRWVAVVRLCGVGNGGLLVVSRVVPEPRLTAFTR